MLQSIYAKIQLSHLVAKLFYKAVAIQNIQGDNHVGGIHNLGSLRGCLYRPILEQVHTMRFSSRIRRRYGVGDYQF